MVSYLKGLEVNTSGENNTLLFQFRSSLPHMPGWCKWYSNWDTDWTVHGIVASFPPCARAFSPLPSVHTSSTVHKVSCSMGTSNFLPASTAEGIMKLTTCSISCLDSVHGHNFHLLQGIVNVIILNYTSQKWVPCENLRFSCLLT